MTACLRWWRQYEVTSGRGGCERQSGSAGRSQAHVGPGGAGQPRRRHAGAGECGRRRLPAPGSGRGPQRSPGVVIGGFALIFGPTWWLFWAGLGVAVVGGLLAISINVFEDWY